MLDVRTIATGKVSSPGRSAHRVVQRAGLLRTGERGELTLQGDIERKGDREPLRRVRADFQGPFHQRRRLLREPQPQRERTDPGRAEFNAAVATRVRAEPHRHGSIRPRQPQFHAGRRPCHRASEQGGPPPILDGVDPLRFNRLRTQFGVGGGSRRQRQGEGQPNQPPQGRRWRPRSLANARVAIQGRGLTRKPAPGPRRCGLALRGNGVHPPSRNGQKQKV